MTWLHYDDRRWQTPTSKIILALYTMCRRASNNMDLAQTVTYRRHVERTLWVWRQWLPAYRMQVFSFWTWEQPTHRYFHTHWITSLPSANAFAGCSLMTLITYKKLSCRRGTARRATSVETLSTATQLNEKLHSKGLAILVRERTSRLLKVIGIAAIW